MPVTFHFRTGENFPARPSVQNIGAFTLDVRKREVMISTKRRAVAGSTTTYEKVDSRFDPVTRTFTQHVVYPERQEVITEGHPYHELGKSRRDIGGDFTSRKIEVELYDLEEIPTSNSTGSVRETGSIFANSSVSQLLFADGSGGDGYPSTQSLLAAWTPSLFQVSDLDGFGSNAISLVSPTNPLIDGSTAVAELISGIPGLPGAQGNLGGEYLNYTFGIAPTLSDAKKVRSAVQDAETALQQLERDSGRVVRRRYEEPPVRDTVVSTANQNPVLSGRFSTFVVRGGPCKSVTTTSTEKWFSGAFTYYLPKEGWRRTLAELDYLYGVVPDANTAWNLLPFSWLVDWFVDIGAVMQNITNFAGDGLVMQYGYVMARQKRTVEYTVPVNYQTTSGWQSTIARARVVGTTLQRRRATPFGFGIDLSDLSVRQIGILAALGISRA